MSDFELFFTLGFGHLLEIGAADHILFITVLVATYRPREWKPVILLATAFTLGHSVTLALSALDIITLPETLVEILIAASIVIAAIWNLRKPPEFRKKRSGLYAIAAGFGLIHGLGYAGQLKPMLMPDTPLWKALLAFNLGLEVAQVIVVIALMVLAYLVINLLGFALRKWTLVLSVFAGAYAAILVIQRILSIF